MASPHSQETKAAVLAALLTGQRVTAVAEAYQLPKQTVSRWNDQAKELLSRGVGTEKGQLDVAAGLSTYLEAALKAITVQVEHSTDRAWLREQDASSFAVLHGVMVDKIIRLLEAAEAGRAAAEAIDGEAAG